jgi:hypothetical protein
MADQPDQHLIVSGPRKRKATWRDIENGGPSYLKKQARLAAAKVTLESGPSHDPSVEDSNDQQASRRETNYSSNGEG